MDNNNNTMEYRIGLEKQNKRNDQVTELILDNCRAPQISGLTDEFVNLETLSLINIGLITLKGFPRLPKLKKLELSDNRLTGGLNLLHGSPKLLHLNISGNRIKDFEALEPLKEFHDLVNLDLYNCEVTKADDYRKKVFDLLPNLNSLDGYDRNEREVADSDESEDENSEIENRITREENDIDEEEDDDEDDDDDDDDDEEESDYEDEYADDNFDDEEGEENDDEDDDDDDDDIQEVSMDNNNVSAAEISNDIDGSGDIVQADGQVIEAEDDDDDDQDDEIDDEEIGEDEDDLADLKELQKDSIEEDSDDGDFEPQEEDNERDHEIDPEDDIDENDEEEHDAPLSTSKLESSSEAKPEPEADTARGQKRKLEDEGGDE